MFDAEGTTSSFTEQDNEFESVLSGQIASFDNLFDGKTEHADNAVDFSDEEELADEEEPTKGVSSDNEDLFGEKDEEAGLEEEDDFMKELEQEALEGVEGNGDPETISEALFGQSIPGHVGLQDLDFASNSVIDSAKQIGDSDIELSDEDEQNGEEYGHDNTNNKAIDGEGHLISEAEKKQKELEKQRKEQAIKEVQLKIFFPTFEKGRHMKLQTLFPIVPLDFSYQQPPPVEKPLLPTCNKFDVSVDQSMEFKMPVKKYREYQKRLRKAHTKPDVTIVQINPEEQLEQSSIGEEAVTHKEIIPIKYDPDMIISTADWNDDNIFDASEDLEILPPPKRLKMDINDLDVWDDDDENMIFEGNLNLDSINLKLDMNDPHLVFMEKENKYPIPIHIKNSDATIPSNPKLLELKFNISNDKDYEPLKANYQTRVRATIGTLSIEHAPPALRLQFPFYKVSPTEKENRLYHRPKFTVKTNQTIVFSKLKTRKKKKDRGKDASEIFRNSTDLTLGDSAPIFLSEYSEEYPLMMNKFGMSTKIINYYRKMNDDDNNRPKSIVGETHILGVNDRSPFWNFGMVERGTTVPTFYNKMSRAPIFHHEPYSTDFLLIRSTGGNIGQRYYLRPINYLLTVGQTLPAIEIPGPHSRRATTLMKNRLRMIAYRALNANENTRITVKDISDHFPKQTDMQIRQRLKEFMEYQRSGPDQGFWTLKSNNKPPDYEAIRRMMTPEDVCVLSTMMWGQQKFEDLDLFRRERLDSSDENANKKDKDGKENNIEESLSQQLAPWNTTRNFIQATQGKAMLQIHGEGDPSKSGRAMSFLKISMKGGFIKNVEGRNESKPGTPSGNTSSAPHTYNVAIQQKLYDEQINKVWYKQAASLSRQRNTDKPRVAEINELSDQYYLKKANRAVDEEVNEKPRYLRITRMVKNAYGIKERKVQVIKDPKVVELYVKKKQEQLVEMSANADSNAVLITNDEEENMKVKKRLEQELAKLEKQAEKKKKKQTGITAANIDSEGRISGKGIGKGKSTSRRCATCGSLGHIRTNKTCPLYYTVHNKSNPNYIPGSELIAQKQGINGVGTNGSITPQISTVQSPSNGPSSDNLEGLPSQPPH